MRIDRPDVATGVALENRPRPGNLGLDPAEHGRLPVPELYANAIYPATTRQVLLAGQPGSCSAANDHAGEQAGLRYRQGLLEYPASAHDRSLTNVNILA